MAGLESRSARPAAHGVHDVAPAVVMLPATHMWQGVDGSLSSSASPAAHSVHSVEPIGLNVPTGQLAHGVDGSES